MRFRGLQEAANGRFENVTGSAKNHLKVVGIDDECEVLIIDGLKTEMTLDSGIYKNITV